MFAARSPERDTFSSSEQTFDHPEHQLVLQEAVDTAKEAEARLDRLGAALAEIVPTWSMAPVVAAYQAMRGVNFLAATTLGPQWAICGVSTTRRSS